MHVYLIKHPRQSRVDSFSSSVFSPFIFRAFPTINSVFITVSKKSGQTLWRDSNLLTYSPCDVPSPKANIRPQLICLQDIVTFLLCTRDVGYKCCLMPLFLLTDSSLLLPSNDVKSLFHKRLKTHSVKLSPPWRHFRAPRKVVFASDFHLLKGTFHLSDALNLLSDNCF